MNSITLRKIVLHGLVLLGFLFGGLAWSQRPEDAMVWLTGMLTIPVAWALVAMTGALPGPDKPDARRRIYNSLLGAALMVTGALIVAAAAALETIPDEWTTRFGMLATALVLIVIGNGLPKKIEPGCSRTRSLAIQRVLGWTFVVTGLVSVLIWLTVPIDWARIAGLVVYGVAVLFAISAVLQIRRDTHDSLPEITGKPGHP